MTDKPPEMVEWVARALANADGIDFKIGEASPAREFYCTRARAAIAAMAEPTSQMLFEGVVAQDSADPAVQRIYQAMIAAALAPNHPAI